MLRNLRSNILTQEPTTLEHIFYRLLKKFDALRPFLQYYDRLRDDHSDRSYRFLSKMVNKAIREERHRKNQEALVISASGGSKPRPTAPGVQQPGDAYPRAEYKKEKARGGSPSEGAALKGKGKGKRKGKGKGRRDSDSSSCSDADTAARKKPPDGVLRNKDLSEDEVCCINHVANLCQPRV